MVNMERNGGGSHLDVAVRVHVVLVVLPVQGHINPFISIANYLAASGLSVTLVRSARAHSLLSSAQNSSSSSLAQSRNDAHNMWPVRIEVVPDGMPADPKQRLPVDAFRGSSGNMRKGVEELLEKLMHEEQPPRCLIFDDLIDWGHDVAVRFGLPWMSLWTGSVSGFSIGLHLTELLVRGCIPAFGKGLEEKKIDFVPGMSPFCVRDLPTAMRVEDPQGNPILQFFCSIFSNAKHADRLLVNTVHETESCVVEALRKEAGLHVDPVGPLFMMRSQFSPVDSPTTASLLREDNSCLAWLDQQQDSSVLYISFGSIVSLEDDALQELAYGLEASGLNFLWVIRPDAFSAKASLLELLPEGFMDRTCDRGRIITWAPQLAVLGHPSVGAFLSHCGWNSVMESLCNGVPVLGIPQQADQTTNLKLIVQDWKVGLPLLQPNMQHIERLHVQRAMTAVMRGDEGKELRMRASEWKETALKACKGSSKSNLEKLVDDLKSGNLKAPNALQA